MMSRPVQRLTSHNIRQVKARLGKSNHVNQMNKKSTTTTNDSNVVSNMKKKRPLSETEQTKVTECQFLICARNSSHTCSVEIISRSASLLLANDTTNKKKTKKERTKKMKKPILKTSLILPSLNSSINLNTSYLCKNEIHVKPLLVLDLNGILCRRLRAREIPAQLQNISSLFSTDKNQTIHQYYRTPITSIARTPIIARTDLEQFLPFLDEYFTLAVWTSAKLLTAKSLVKTLIPDDIRRRLLFIWGQDRCESIYMPRTAESEMIKSIKKTYQSEETAIEKDQQTKIPPQSQPESNYYQKTLFRKHLSKVWAKYPLWNEFNTLYLDDSPEKCPEKYSGNALHPPPISGLNSFALNCLVQDTKGWGTNISKADIKNESSSTFEDMDESVRIYCDEINQKKQLAFFEKLVKDWKICTTTISTSTEENAEDKFIHSHLSQFAKGHMGYRISSANKKSSK